MKVLFSDLLPGETPIDDVTGLKIPRYHDAAGPNLVEAEGIRKALRKYFGVDALTTEIAPFDFGWAQSLHREMFEDV